ncbi:MULTISPECIES: DUF2848 domain-containing protein [Paraburkholderia]|uniref:DUF2848 domain-containing protein n=1 Tax=Paraburkholderia dipogonis TaxID=1211383 RepID=A0A4Y8MGZ7_9BURK|nr:MULTISPECIES: DUF2848 domain-containing protein [Paraburkholderia]TFE36709.1 DUF2848 domain-containing protein [Paraburkholderia dipogonis]
MKSINFEVVGKNGNDRREVSVHRLIVAGWTGRDTVAMEAHIRELEELGVKRPATTPVFYRISLDRLTTADAIEVSGSASSGEAEFILIKDSGEVFVGIASDHTDREVETYGVTVSKQMCEKPCGATLWRLTDVQDHWDELILRSYATIDGKRVLYQEGPVTTMHAPRDLMSRYNASGAEFEDGCAMLGGTLAAIGGIRPAQRFEVELEDPVLKRKLHHGYEVSELAING